MNILNMVENKIFLKLTVFVVIASLLYPIIGRASHNLPLLNDSLQINSAFDKNPVNNGLQTEFREEYERRGGRLCQDENPKKILLIYIVDRDCSSIDFPIGVYVLKSYLENRYPEKCIVEIKDVQIDRLEDIVNFASIWKPHIIGVSLMVGALKELDEFMALLSARISPADRPRLVIGKNMPTFAYGKLLMKYPDAICVRGEGELAIGGLLEYIRGERQLKDVPNIAYLKDNKVTETSRELLFEFGCFGKVDYSYSIPYLLRGGNLWMETARGCPWGYCTFCSTKLYWGTVKWRNKSISTIIEELKDIKGLGIKRITFTDEEFFGYGINGIEHARKLALAIIESGVKISFYINARANAIYNKDDTIQERDKRIEVLRLLKKAGLQIIYIGGESGSPSQLKRYSKGINIVEFQNAIRICKELNIEMAIGWIMLEPLVSREEILENIDFIRRNQILPYLSTPLNRMRMYPSIPYFKLVKNEEKKLGRKLIDDQYSLDELTFNVVGYKNPEVGVIVELLELYIEGEQEVYSWLKWFVRFSADTKSKTYAFLKESLEMLKEYQIDLVYELAMLSPEELLDKDKQAVREKIIKNAMSRREILLTGLGPYIRKRDSAKRDKNTIVKNTDNFSIILDDMSRRKKTTAQIMRNVPRRIGADYLERKGIFRRFGRGAKSALPDICGVSTVIQLDSNHQLEAGINYIKKRIKQTKAFRRGKIKLIPNECIHHTVGIFNKQHTAPISEDEVLGYIRKIEQQVRGINPFPIYLEGISWLDDYTKLIINIYSTEELLVLEDKIRGERLPYIGCSFAVIVEGLTKEELDELNSVVLELSEKPLAIAQVDKIVVHHYRNHFAQDSLLRRDIPLSTKELVNSQIDQITSAYTKFIDDNADLIAENKNGFLLRVPIEIIENMEIENAIDFFNIFQKVPDCYIELYYMSGNRDVSEGIYERYKIKQNIVPEGFIKTRENTITLFADIKDEEVSLIDIVPKIGNLGLSPTNTILFPVGNQLDPTGLIRSTFLGIKVMNIARCKSELGIIDNEFVEETLDQYKKISESLGVEGFNLTSQDLIDIAVGDIDKITKALKKLIELLPKTPISDKDLKQIYNYANRVLISA